jgi:hypothetical protein
MERLTKAWKVSCIAYGAIAVVGTGVAPLLAQTANPYPQNSTTNDQENNNPFSNSGQDATSSLYGLINRLQLLNSRSPSDFAAEQNEGFQSAVDEFHQKQKQKLQNSATPAPQTPQPATPSRSTP